jgi:hypothetical protein
MIRRTSAAPSGGVIAGLSDAGVQTTREHVSKVTPKRRSDFGRGHFVPGSLVLRARLSASQESRSRVS